MAMKKLFLLCSSLVSVAIILGGCLIVETHSVLNNTGKDITVIPEGTTNSLAHPLKQGEAFEFYSPSLEIRHRTGTWRYEMKRYVLQRKAGEKRLIKFDKRTRGNHILVRMQIEQDGSIFLIPPDSIAPVAHFPDQPEGFPLHPK